LKKLTKINQFNQTPCNTKSSDFYSQITSSKKKQNYNSLNIHRDYIYRDYLLDLLLALDGVVQSPEYHPESDALYHSLQVFEWAYQSTNDIELWQAALFHDVGKSVDSKYHSEFGAQMLSGIFSDRVIWIIKHHLDLMKNPGKTRQKLLNSSLLSDLQKIRKWDLAGRDPNASVRDVDEVLDLVLY